VARNKIDVFEQLHELPTRNYIKVLRERIQDLTNRLPPAYYDQYPGKKQPRIYSKRYGPIPLTTARRVGTTAFEGAAALASNSSFLSPIGTNILTGRVGTFQWEAINTFAFFSWTYQTDPAFGTPAPVNPLAASDIFNPVIEQNGGAAALLNFSGLAFTADQPNISLDLDIYDKKRGVSLTDGKVPIEAFTGTTFGPKENKYPMLFPVDTEIEPRLYVNEFKMGTLLDTQQYFDAASVVGWVTLVFEGSEVSEDRLVEDVREFSAERTP